MHKRWEHCHSSQCKSDHVRWLQLYGTNCGTVPFCGCELQVCDPTLPNGPCRQSCGFGAKSQLAPFQCSYITCYVCFWCSMHKSQSAHFQYLSRYTWFHMVCGWPLQTGWRFTFAPQHWQASVYTSRHMQTRMHRLKHEKMERKEVKRIEWVAVGEKDGERGRGRVGVSGTWLSV